MSRPNFVTAASFAQIEERARLEKQAATEKKMQSAFNDWWSGTVIAYLTTWNLFERRHGRVVCRISMPHGDDQDYDVWLKMTDKRVLDTGAPFHVQRAGTAIEFYCV